MTIAMYLAVGLVPRRRHMKLLKSVSCVQESLLITAICSKYEIIATFQDVIILHCVHSAI